MGGCALRCSLIFTLSIYARHRHIDTDMSNDWQFLLDQLLTIDRPFQSLQPFLSSKHSLATSCQWLVRRLEAFEATNDAYEHLGKAWQRHIRRAFQAMLHGERVARAHEHFVFYRVVNDKYVLYEFNTCMLRALSSSALHNVEDDALVCTPSLDEDLYPDTLEDLLVALRHRRQGTDCSRNMAQTVLSVNNCLFPAEVSTLRLHDGRIHNHAEASPVEYFLCGYDESHYYRASMEDFLMKYCMASRDAAHRVVNRLFKWQCAMNPKRMGQHERVMGHLLQITVPREQAARFVHASVSWGLPGAIRRVETDEAERLHVYSDVPREDGLGEGLEVLLDSPQQARYTHTTVHGGVL
jgi:hypothetical protein